jgi:hypothetical protein
MLWRSLPPLLMVLCYHLSSIPHCIMAEPLLIPHDVMVNPLFHSLLYSQYNVTFPLFVIILWCYRTSLAHSLRAYGVTFPPFLMMLWYNLSCFPHNHMVSFLQLS